MSDPCVALWATSCRRARRQPGFMAWVGQGKDQTGDVVEGPITESETERWKLVEEIA